MSSSESWAPAHEAAWQGSRRTPGHCRRHEGWRARADRLGAARLLDGARGISAMERTTGYSLSITGQMQARGEITPAGVHTPDECVPAARYIAELAKRGVNIRELKS